MKIESTLNEDASIAEVVVDGKSHTMTVMHVERAIRELAALRERMAPQVPNQNVLDGDFQVYFAPGWSMPGQSMGHVHLQLRHPGFGWLNLAFPEDAARLLSDLLIQGAEVIGGKAEAGDPAKPGSRDAGIHLNSPPAVN